MENKKDTIIYFAGAIKGDRSLGENMKEFVSFMKSEGYEVLTEHVGADDPVTIFAEKIGKNKEDLTAFDIEKQDIKWLGQSTHVVAEISGASTGTGREIEYARTKGDLGMVPAKVLCIYHKDREFYASSMIRGMNDDRYPNVEVKSYSNIEEAKRIIRDFLES